jgi:hypothetical protein
MISVHIYARWSPESGIRRQGYERKTKMLHETESGLIQQGEVDRRCFRYIPFRVELWEEAFICAGLLGYEDH